MNKPMTRFEVIVAPDGDVCLTFLGQGIGAGATSAFDANDFVITALDGGRTSFQALSHVDKAHMMAHGSVYVVAVDQAEHLSADRVIIQA